MRRFWLMALGGCLVVILVAGFWLYHQRQQWLAGFNAEHQQQAEQFRERGHELGLHADQQTCLDTVLKEYNANCRGFDCTVRYGQMLKHCFDVARPTPGFCNGVPAYQEKPDDNVKYWIYHQCWDRDVPDPGCRMMMKQRQQLCTPAS